MRKEIFYALDGAFRQGAFLAVRGLLAAEDALNFVKRETAEARKYWHDAIKREKRSFVNSWRMARDKNYHYFACVLSTGHKWERQGAQEWFGKGTWFEFPAPSVWICKRCDAMAIG